jgi:hypothetical protein
VNRRAFLRGAAGVSVALPFLESLPDRSAWALDDSPVFSLFLCAAGGVVLREFFPTSAGPLKGESLGASGTAGAELAAHAERLLFLTNVNWPAQPTGEPHAEGPSMALTGQPPTGSSSTAHGSGPSADVVIASHVHPDLEPLTLYAGNIRNGYIAERLSFTNEGVTRAAVDNPYVLYQELMGIVGPSGMTPGGDPMAAALIESRKHIHDLVRDDLTTLMNDPRMSYDDRQRLQLHFDSIRDAENTMGGMGGEAMELCASKGLDVTALEALSDWAFTTDGMIEKVVELHMSLVALAFACNYRRTATLQWGDGTDGTIYPVPANEKLGKWRFNHISHRAQSDAAVGTNPVAEQAHVEIDVVRMKTFARGLDHFAARELGDRSLVLWTNHYAEGPSHDFRNVPHIIWGSGGGYLKQGEIIDAGSVSNGKLLATLISAAIQDTGSVVDDFGSSTGQLDVIRA